MSAEIQPASAQSSKSHSQLELRDRIAERAPAVLKFVKEKPIVGWRLNSDRLEDIPKAIRERLGDADDTNYSQAYLVENRGTIIALQMDGETPDFYIIKKAAYETQYEEVDLVEALSEHAALAAWVKMHPQLAAEFSAGSRAIVGARKTGVVDMMKVSDLGFEIQKPLVIQSPWGEQSKPAGQEGYLALDAASGKYYLVNQSNSGHPLSYVPAP